MKKLWLALLGFCAGTLCFAQSYELNCFINDPDVEGKTNIRAAPGGKVIYQVDASDFYQLTAIVQEGGWWKIKDSRLESFGEEIEIPSKEAWIHRSVLALGTDNSDGHCRVLRKEPRADAARAGMIYEAHALVRPLEMSSDGKWVKVKYEPASLTGWIEVSWMRDDAFEPGDGYGLHSLPVYASPVADLPLFAGPGKGGKTYTLKKGKTYEINVMNARDGWWEIMDESVYIDGDVAYLPEISWVQGKEVCVRINPESGAPVPIYSQADDKARVVGHLSPGTEVHPLDYKGEWPIWVRISADSPVSIDGWVDYFKLYFAPLTYIEVAGMYDTADSESRVCLNEDGTGTWNMIGSLHWTDFTYIIRGNGIYLDIKEVGPDSKPAYIYDAQKKALDDGQGTLYYRQ